MNEVHRRQSFLGAGSDVLLHEIRAAIIGLGGGGSHIVQQLAHLGVGHFFLCDDDTVESSNLNRLVGATYQDAVYGTSKTHVASRLIKSVNPSAVVEPLMEKWQVSERLLRSCDVVFGCVDSY